MFGINLGFNSKKSSSTTNESANQTSNETSTPNAPDWLSTAWQSLFAKGGVLGDLDPSAMVPGATQNQRLAFNRASTLGAAPGAILGDVAANGAGPMAQATATRAVGMLGDYQNPFEDDVVASTLEDMGRGLQTAKSQVGRSFVGAGGYGGSRQGVENANLNSDFIRGVGSVAGNLRSQGFQTALGAAGADADRMTGVSTFNAGQTNAGKLADLQAKLQAGGMLGDNERSNLAMLGDLGAEERAVLGEQAAAPLTQLQLLAQLYGLAPEDAFVGRTTVGSSSSTSTSTSKGKGSGFSAGLLGGSKK